MTPVPTTSRTASKIIGKLCADGDWACAHGDFGNLRYVAQQLEDFMPEPVHCELVQLAAACISDPERASLLWDRLKSSLYREATS